ncbi:unnamed protein product [Microthlaspi erraticum]|uniref:Uncharacterized protein n=1 Tax=Microthlaspi erraticum TaxID=1685480 RepID=A0A6D2I5T2_9BRAS|nr:unnamed protein product [Microthlaspi erraticum]
MVRARLKIGKIYGSSDGSGRLNVGKVYKSTAYVNCACHILNLAILHYFCSACRHYRGWFQCSMRLTWGSLSSRCLFEACQVITCREEIADGDFSWWSFLSRIKM